MKSNPLSRRRFISGGIDTTKLLVIRSLANSLEKSIAQPARSGNALRLPPVWEGGTLTAAPATLELWPGFPTALSAINGSVPSPTIRVHKGQQFSARIENHLIDDLVIHWQKGDCVRKKTKAKQISRASGSQPVRLELTRPAAREVFVAGSFNDWQPTTTPLTPAGDGKWVVELSLPPGRYDEYCFVADGEWVDDPNAKRIVPNPHGGANALLVVPPA